MRSSRRPWLSAGIGPLRRACRSSMWRVSISLQPPQPGTSADADLDQAHIGLGMGLHGGAVQQDLAAAAERHAGRARRRRGTARISAPCRSSGRRRSISSISATARCWRRRARGRDWRRPRNCCPRCRSTSAFVLARRPAAMRLAEQRDGCRGRARSSCCVNSKQATPSPMSHSAGGAVLGQRLATRA